MHDLGQFSLQMREGKRGDHPVDEYRHKHGPYFGDKTGDQRWTFQRRELLTRHREDWWPRQGWLTLLVWGPVGHFSVKVREWFEMIHTRPLPELIVLDSSISVGFEI